MLAPEKMLTEPQREGTAPGSQGGHPRGLALPTPGLARVHHSHAPKLPVLLSPSGSGPQLTGLCQVKRSPSKDAGRGSSDHSGQPVGQLMCPEGLGVADEPGTD